MYNAARDNYVVDAEQMRLVKRIFYMVGVEEYSIRGVKRVFEREGLPTPDGKRNWAAPFIRGCISDDVYTPHNYQEVEPLVSTEVATGLDPEKRYDKLLKLRVNSSTDGAPDVSEALGDVDEICKTETISRSSSTA